RSASGTEHEERGQGDEGTIHVVPPQGAAMGHRPPGNEVTAARLIVTEVGGFVHASWRFDGAMARCWKNGLSVRHPRRRMSRGASGYRVASICAFRPCSPAMLRRLTGASTVALLAALSSLVTLSSAAHADPEGDDGARSDHA